MLLGFIGFVVFFVFDVLLKNSLKTTNIK